LEAKDPDRRAEVLRALLEIESFHGGANDGAPPKAS
jgi:hypothetical protein